MAYPVGRLVNVGRLPASLPLESAYFRTDFNLLLQVFCISVVDSLIFLMTGRNVWQLVWLHFQELPPANLEIVQ